MFLIYNYSVFFFLALASPSPTQTKSSKESEDSNFIQYGNEKCETNARVPSPTRLYTDGSSLPLQSLCLLALAPLDHALTSFVLSSPTLLFTH